MFNIKPANKNNLFGGALIALLVFSIPIQTRIFIGEVGGTLQGNEFLTAWLWASDIIIFFFIATAIARRHKIIKSLVLIFLGLFVFFVILSSIYAINDESSLWQLFKLIEFILLFIAAQVFSSKNIKDGLVYGLAAGATFQSIIAFLQFRFQHEAGFWILGESPINVNMPGVAETIITNASVLRAYGTTPHPNILAAYLAVTIIILSAYLINYFKWTKEEKDKKSTAQKIVFGGVILLSFFGIILTASRVSWFVLASGLCILFFWVLMQKKYWFKPILSVAGINATAIFFVFLALYPFIVPRLTVNRYEQAVGLRLFYNQIAREIIGERPLTGVGSGAFSEHIGKPSPTFQLKNWLYQPVHNIYLLIGAENGLPALAAFIAFVGAVLFFGIKNIVKNEQDKIFRFGVFISACAILFIGLFDHFPWTLQQGRMMLWLLLASILV
ncbi:MAG: hypothetical protein A3A97_04150 [Candidatus Terrybacteria bacterium RIFCSPLOWO2_01_FULL_40_23]|uniref:O-antigen ligase-related domain-containing protein n=1 Tax=Candidatus Terrybacteria bacterium RIFCSPLOWO2_01_FULL_40_23 TaxID=1802366 RepID=A0A1G2PQI8_9BACT|nr:MAG: hypothetical protein UT82_C0004G0033 [Parcubacteria group bacterium GW2011_GWB1_40_14]OHA50616.1 MAG: hypothetical protein A3A97_04150 [Candidatus Terrybacteria bacterium RIFCSPLOWO2_01_FULL_40_23]